jgi:S-adenosylmethionine:tRNA ribosyltransferase-isomerase
VVEFSEAPDLGAYGELPLPPYMERRADAMDDERYQTVYATEEGSVAAPTAGLHFDAELLASVPHTFVTLHVGAGTFRPVQVADVREHRMHTERFVISEETAGRVEAARRVIAVGTTTVRVLESVADGEGRVPAGAGETNIFIRPPHAFRVVDALLTNFHFPESTLLMLVSAFADRELMLSAYEDAVRERYRFFSYGDCMLIL